MQRTLRIIAIIAALGLPLAACAGHGQVRVTGHVDATQPTLVQVAPGIWVVEDHHRPVFYHDGWYWLYSDGIWLRSHVYTGSFVRVHASYVPNTLVRIDRPRAYVHYEARPGVRVRKAPPPRARPDRKAPPPRARPDRKAPPPRARPDHKVRDHRERDDARDHRERDHRDHARERKPHDRSDKRDHPRKRGHHGKKRGGGG